MSKIQCWYKIILFYSFKYMNKEWVLYDGIGDEENFSTNGIWYFFYFLFRLLPVFNCSIPIVNGMELLSGKIKMKAEIIS